MSIAGGVSGASIDDDLLASADPGIVTATSSGFTAGGSFFPQPTSPTKSADDSKTITALRRQLTSFFE
jgi:hypothetical protein